MISWTALDSQKQLSGGHRFRQNETLSDGFTKGFFFLSFAE
jgi:hypothetical protein